MKLVAQSARTVILAHRMSTEYPGRFARWVEDQVEAYVMPKGIRHKVGAGIDETALLDFGVPTFRATYRGRPGVAYKPTSFPRMTPFMGWSFIAWPEVEGSLIPTRNIDPKDLEFTGERKPDAMMLRFEPLWADRALPQPEPDLYTPVPATVPISGSAQSTAHKPTPVAATAATSTTVTTPAASSTPAPTVSSRAGKSITPTSLNGRKYAFVDGRLVLAKHIKEATT